MRGIAPSFRFTIPLIMETTPAAIRKAAMICTTVIVASFTTIITRPMAIATSALRTLLKFDLYPNVMNISFPFQ